jgi:hypothetical protein
VSFDGYSDDTSVGDPASIVQSWGQFLGFSDPLQTPSPHGLSERIGCVEDGVGPGLQAEARKTIAATRAVIRFMEIALFSLPLKPYLS